MQYPDALDTVSDLKAWLSLKGINKTGSKPELIERVLTAEPETQILDVLKKDHEAKANGKILLKPL